jgi:hypothetical protein
LDAEAVGQIERHTGSEDRRSVSAPAEQHSRMGFAEHKAI